MQIYAEAINQDHVHMLISIPPHLSVSKAVQFLKGKSLHKFLTEYVNLCNRYWVARESLKNSHFSCSQSRLQPFS